MEKIIIIGGGASGLVTALTAQNKDVEITILEKNNTCGKKILKTGNGRCNYFNESISIDNYNSSNKDLLEKIIYKDNTDRVINFFNDLGIISNINKGYYYPFSNQASTIRNTLLEELNDKVKIREDFLVTDIKISNNKFEVYSNKNKIIGDKLVLAIGSNAYSDIDVYKILKNLNHQIIKPLPALVPLKVSFPYLKKWAGIRTKVKVSLLENNKIIGSEEGEIQLTNDGISGICVFNLSSKAIRGLDNNKKEEMQINFLPFIKTIDEFIKLLDTYKDNLTIESILSRIINNKLSSIILDYAKIEKDKTLKELTIEEKECLGNNLLNLTLKITGYRDFTEAQTTSGGISLEDVNLKTMESKKIKNLYFTGEVLDVDGICGGYNLTFAFLSAIIVGDNL